MVAFKINESADDRLARITVGVFLVSVGLALDGIWGHVFGVGGLVLLVTGLIGWCPLYAIFKIKPANRFTINLYRKGFFR